MDASFFILISFSVFAYIFYKKLWPSLVSMLDEHIAIIKKQFHERQVAIKEYEKLETINKQRLHHLQKEIEAIKVESLKKLEFLKQKLDADMESQYLQRQKSFQQAIKRIQEQQRKALQSRCIDEIFAKVKEKIEKNSSFEAKYMVSVTQLIK
jgi:F0F1-type ATP synthase membrane subunit b/b'